MSARFEYRPPAMNALVEMLAVKTVAETAGAEVVLQESQPLVPLDTGDLKASGTVGHDGTSATITYSAVNAQDNYDYAAIQHERTDYNHPRGGQAKYLEQPMHTSHEAVRAAMTEVVRAVFE